MSAMESPSYLPRYDIGLPTATFGTAAYKQLALAGNDNIIFSPFSICLAVLLAYTGAEGQTKRQIESTLNMQGYSRKEVLQGYGHTMKWLAQLNGADAAYRLDVANNAYVDKKFPLKTQYVQDIKNYLGVTPSAEDFQGNADGVRQKINKWAENATDNKVKEPLSSGSITQDTALVLVNAIYFKSEWDVQFMRYDTEDNDFNNLNGQKSQIKMMFQTGQFLYSHNKDAGFQFIAIQHKNQQNALFIIMPDADRDFKALKHKE